MKHAGEEALATLAPLLVRVRQLEPLREMKPGIFYLKSRAFLHFHEDPKGLFADVRLELSGLNFVIQPGVTGTVTVELTDVPWDQALDLILKTNDLGYELEGNILRIAPLAKLRDEAEAEQRLRQAQAQAIPIRSAADAEYPEMPPKTVVCARTVTTSG